MSNLYIGQKVPSNIYIDTREVSSIYLGTTKIWSKQTPVTPSSITVNITNAGNANTCYVSYGNTNYYTSGRSFSVNAGDTIVCYVRGYNATYKGQVIVNGVSKFSQTSNSTGSYSWQVPNNITTISIQLQQLSQTVNKNTYNYGTITITTQ